MKLSFLPIHPPPHENEKRSIDSRMYERELKLDDFCNIFVVVLSRGHKKCPRSCIIHCSHCICIKAENKGQKNGNIVLLNSAAVMCNKQLYFLFF
jgi:hypothetical protein